MFVPVRGEHWVQAEVFGRGCWHCFAFCFCWFAGNTYARLVIFWPSKIYNEARSLTGRKSRLLAFGWLNVIFFHCI